MSAKDESKYGLNCVSVPAIVSLAKYAIISGLVIAVGSLGDRILTLKRTPFNSGLIAVSDTLIHGVIGFFSWLLVCVFNGQPLCQYMLLVEAMLCGFTASAIDLDHVIAARSFHIKVRLIPRQVFKN